MRFALVTDVHLGPAAWHEGKLRKLSQHGERLTQEFVERMNRVERPELVINLGDVIEDQNCQADRRGYARFMELISELTMPVLHVAGNHDSVNLDDRMLAQFWGHAGPLHYSRTLGGIHFVVLRTLYRALVDVRMPVEELAWLRIELAAASSPVIILVHHPLSDMLLRENRWFAKTPCLCLVAERQEVRRILRDSAKVVAVFSGHAHWNHLDVIDGIPYLTLQSLIENIDDDAPGRPAKSYAVVDFDSSRMFVRVEGEQPARYQFEGPGRPEDSDPGDSE